MEIYNLLLSKKAYYNILPRSISSVHNKQRMENFAELKLI